MRNVVECEPRAAGVAHRGCWTPQMTSAVSPTHFSTLAVEGAPRDSNTTLYGIPCLVAPAAACKTILAGASLTDNWVSSVLDSSLHKKMVGAGFTAGFAYDDARGVRFRRARVTHSHRIVARRTTEQQRERHDDQSSEGHRVPFGSSHSLACLAGFGWALRHARGPGGLARLRPGH